MNFALVFSFRGWNLGDDIQMLAAMNFLPRVDHIIDRERISRARVPRGTKAFLNGWYMHDARYWPPPENLDPLFLSFHAREARPPHWPARMFNRLIGSGTRKSCVSPEHAPYYLRHAPIGCRDQVTAEALGAMGVPAYFSGCLSLTLGGMRETPSQKIVFSDPFSPFPWDAFHPGLWGRLPVSLRRDAVRVTHALFSRSFKTRVARARHVLGVYARAKVVVTSRLHAALPCAAMGVPVILLGHPHRESRFTGYEDILHPVALKDFLTVARGGDILSLVCRPDQKKIKILSEDLSQRCRAFLK